MQIPAIPVGHLPGRYFTSDVFRHLEQRLVAGCLDNHMIACVQDGVHVDPDGFFRAGVNQHLIVRGVLVDAGNLGAQAGSTGAFGIAEPELMKILFRTWLEGQQLVNRPGLTIGTAQQVAGGEFMRGEEPLQLKRRWFHSRSVYNADDPG